MRTEAAAAAARPPPPALLAGRRPATAGADGRLRSPLLDARQVELLILNQDASLAVHARPQFFVWTQGLLQGLLPHRALLCALSAGEPANFRCAVFAAAQPADRGLGGLLQRDATFVPWLARAWKQQRFRPVACGTGELGGAAGGRFARELAQGGAAAILAHGCHDEAGNVRGMYVFAREAPPSPEEAYLAQLCVPFLHEAWVRVHTAYPEDAARAPEPRARALSVREREVLRWVYFGKSNGEIGAILGISPMTVKNHVQKILRKLDVVNRAQAVGKALDAQLIGP